MHQRTVFILLLYDTVENTSTIPVVMRRREDVIEFDLA